MPYKTANNRTTARGQFRQEGRGIRGRRKPMKNMKKLLLGIAAVMLCVICMVPAAGVRADEDVVKNNFKQTLVLQPKGSTLSDMWIFRVKNMKSSAKKIKIASSKKSVATAKSLGGGAFQITSKKAGTTNIKITATVNKKTVTYKGTIKVVNYENPFKTLKIDGKSYVSIFNKGFDLYTETASTKFKLGLKLKSGWKLKEAAYYPGNGSTKNYTKKFKNGAEIPVGFYSLLLQNTKTKAYEIFPISTYCNQ